MQEVHMSLVQGTAVVAPVMADGSEVLEGGVKVFNKVGEWAKVNFAGMRGLDPLYTFSVNGRDVLSYLDPSFYSTPHNLGVIRSQTITLSLINRKRFIHVKETDADGQTDNYIDVATLFPDNCYRAYPHMPKEMLRKAVCQKQLSAFSRAKPNFEAKLTGYNRHGVIAIGVEKNPSVQDGIPLVAYFASPQDRKMIKIWGDVLIPNVANSLQAIKLAFPLVRMTMSFSLPAGRAKAQFKLNGDDGVVLSAKALL